MWQPPCSASHSPATPVCCAAQVCIPSRPHASTTDLLAIGGASRRQPEQGATAGSPVARRIPSSAPAQSRLAWELQHARPAEAPGSSGTQPVEAAKPAPEQLPGARRSQSGTCPAFNQQVQGSQQPVRHYLAAG